MGVPFKVYKKDYFIATKAELYCATTKRINEQVKRNIERFPQHFMLQLTEQEKDKAVAHCVILNQN